MNYNVTKKQMKEDIDSKISHFFGVSPEEATEEQFYKAVAMICLEFMRKGRQDFIKKTKKQGNKTIYYLCMEFLMGRSLKNTLYNLNLTDVVDKVLKEHGVSLDKLYECEPDAGLGNGGLGRLAACYLDGLATQGYLGMGYSLLYEYGIFRQKLVDGWQTELPDFWLPGGDVWLVPREDRKIEVRFGGHIADEWDGSFHHVEHVNYTPVYAIPNDMFVAGKDGKGISTLRLWQSKAPGLDMHSFNQGDYLRAVEQNAMAEVITKVLYPADNHPEGKSLRLRQQYFLVSASVQDIVHRHLRQFSTMDNFAEQVAIHINDTHPTMAIPELMRIMLDECGYSWDKAWEIVTNTVAYTNHTVMKEALECWGEDLFSSMLPRIYQIVKEIDNRLRSFVWASTHNAETVENMAIVSNGAVRMANLCVAGSHSVNGVSALHSDILKETVFKDFYTITPGKFTNVTNGIAHRRWLCQSNPALTKLLNELIGDGYIKDASKLTELAKFAGDKEVLKRLEKVKYENKVGFAEIVRKKTGVELDPNSIFDVQVKRLHEYKRQHLNALNILSQYLMLRDNPDMEFSPRTFIFAAKAAPGYYMAKKIIKGICTLANTINNDASIKGKMKVIYLEDYNVSLAEKLMPTADISEQISLAGTEASGTGNMKLMINGAVTLGTLDGANVEIHEAVGDDNIFLFGMTTPEVEQLRNRGYRPDTYYHNNNDIRRAIDVINSTNMAQDFREIGYNLLNSDPYMVLADFADYHRAQDFVSHTWKNRDKWNRMSLMNIAGAGRFAADRAINDYARDIWHTNHISLK